MAGHQRKRGRNMWFGIFLLVAGSVVLLNILFGFNLPLFRIFFGVMLIFWGIKMVFGNHCRFEGRAGISKSDNENSVVFSSGNFSPKSVSELQQKYSTVFGSTVLDLTSLSANEADLSVNEIEINVVFGEMKVLIPENTNIQVESNAVAGSVNLPAAPTNPKKTLNLKVNAVFGAVNIKRK